MSISVHCEECDRTYQVRDEMAGRKGKCPKGHKIFVPGAEDSEDTVEENEFAFEAGSRFDEPKSAKSSKRSKAPDPRGEEPTSPIPDSDFAFPTTGSRFDEPRGASSGKRPAKQAEKRTPEKAKPAPAASSENEFGFDTSTAKADRDRDEDESPKSGRYRAKSIGSSRETAAAKKTMMPLLIGGVLAVVGIGGGVAMFFMQRAEVVPLREKAESAEKRATDAELKMKTAEAVAVAEVANAAAFKKKAEDSDNALKDARTKTSAAEKQVSSLKAQVKALEEAKPMMPDTPMVGKNDNPDAKGANPKVDAGPMGGKNWTAPASITFGMLSHKPGDRYAIMPKEDAVLKAEAGQLRFRFRYVLQKGKEAPTPIFGTVFIAQAGSIDGKTIPITLNGPNGDSEVVIPVKGYTGTGNILFVLSDGNLDAGTRNLKTYSTILALQAEFEKEKD